MMVETSASLTLITSSKSSSVSVPRLQTAMKGNENMYRADGNLRQQSVIRIERVCRSYQTLPHRNELS